MMTETVQREWAQDAMPNFEGLRKLTEDREMGQIRGQETTAIQEIELRVGELDAPRKKRNVQDQFGRRWARHMNLDEIHRMPSLFTWHC